MVAFLGCGGWIACVVAPVVFENVEAGVIEQ
jgi:hypothetical protein